jgi:ABC-type sugar transport system ATPase subunit
VASEPAIEIRGISKGFAGVQALQNVALVIDPGSIHALVGENGAGKSTLGKIIGGAIRPDAGDLIVWGRPVQYHSPRQALADGIGLIQQELELVPGLTVAANVLLGSESEMMGVRLDRRTRSRFREINERAGFELPADVLVEDLGIAQRQKVEILRAMARDARVIVMDEPTSALTADESDKLRETVIDLRANGTTIIYISHFLKDVLELADNVSILRNGQHIRTSSTANETVESLIAGMVGVGTDVSFPPRVPSAPDARTVLSVRGLTRRGVLEDISFDVREGEIVGLAGLLGSGRSEVARALFGADASEGEILLDGEPVKLRAPRQAVAAGIGFVPESRKDDGLLLGLSAAANVTVPFLDRISTVGVIGRRNESRRASAMLQRLRVVPANPRMIVGDMSGGNQQKVLLGRWMFVDRRFMILDEPTRGVDVGARRAIHELIVSLAESGMGILLISSENEELVGLAHRILVMRGGRIVGEYDAEPHHADGIMQAAFGIDSAERN